MWLTSCCQDLGDLYAIVDRQSGGRTEGGQGRSGYMIDGQGGTAFNLPWPRSTNSINWAKVGASKDIAQEQHNDSPGATYAPVVTTEAGGTSERSEAGADLSPNGCLGAAVLDFSGDDGRGR